MEAHDSQIADDADPQDPPPGSVQTGGGAVIMGDVSVVNGDFISRDKHIHTEDESYNVSGLPNPYLGLEAYQFKHRQAFGGRRRVVQEALERLTWPGAGQAALFVTGASGCGKSSFVLAGLLPALEAHYQVRGKQVRWAVFRPSTNPAAMLADALQQMRLADLPPETLLGFSAQAFWAFITEKTAPGQVNLLVIDQFEECFTQSLPAERQWLVDCLAGLPDFGLARTHLLLTLRSDFLDDVFALPPLWEMAKTGLDLRGMTQEEIKDAIQQPLQALCEAQGIQGKRFDPHLLDQLSRDAAEDATYLPLLQFTLYRLWQNGRLSDDRYDRLTDSIREHADRVYTWVDYSAASPTQERTAEERAALINILLALVRVSTADDPRHDVRFRRVKAEVEEGSPLRAQLIADLISARLLSVFTTTASGQTVEWIDIIHESLLTNWPCLSQAIAERRATLLQRARFESDLEAWLGGSRSDGYLLGGIRLAEAEQLDAQQDVALRKADARAFLARSLEKTASETRRQLALERKARQRTQILAGVLLLISLVTVGMLSFPYGVSLWARADTVKIAGGPVSVGPDEKLSRSAETIDFLKGFEIERYEVTNARYKLCVWAGVCSNPSNPAPMLNDTKANDPVTWVSAIQAEQFCRWIGARLPSEIEWERAARGTAGNAWPWGNQPLTPQRAYLAFEGEDNIEPKPVNDDDYKSGCTPDGICGLIGNAAELTVSWLSTPAQYAPTDNWSGTLTKPDFERENVIYRGFDYFTDPAVIQTGTADFVPFYEARESIGFRCVR